MVFMNFSATSLMDTQDYNKRLLGKNPKPHAAISVIIVKRDSSLIVARTVPGRGLQGGALYLGP